MSSKQADLDSGSNGSRAIALAFSDGPGLPRIITTLRSRGYRFLTVPQLLGLRSGCEAPDGP
jgi:peptidoglycan/xylan/chitin deacetylase (PgdA/CDA1 family)